MGDRWIHSDSIINLKPEIRDDITDWKGESKGRRFEVYEEAEIVSLDDKTMQWTSRPYKGGFMAELHQFNRTTRESKQVYNVHMTDEGDHYFMHEVQVAKEFRGFNWLLRAIQRTVFNMPEFLPDYPDKKPIRTLARVVEGIPQEKLISGLLSSGFKILEQDVDGGVLMEFKWLEEEMSNPHYSPPPGIAMFPGELHQGPAALYQQTISISQLNPPRSKPFPWNKNRVKNSPFKTMKKAQASYDSWKKGNAIGFSASSSLKSMGKIPRVSGKYELGEKYARINPPIAYDSEGKPHMLPSEEAVEMALIWELVNRGFDELPAKTGAQTVLNELSNYEAISGINVNSKVMTKNLQVSGINNNVDGFVSKGINISGTNNTVNVVAPVGVKVTLSGINNDNNIQQLSLNEFANALIEKSIRANPMAPGYQSYGWTTQDWRSIKVNSKGDIDYSEKCGAEGTRTKSGKPRLCLAAPIIRSLMKTESGKEVLRTQARKKLRAKKGERVPWHPRIKKLHKKLEERTPEDR